MAKKIECYSVILINYNNEEYIKEAIDSILYQDYPIIQLIILDDGSQKFDKDVIYKYLEKNKKKNIKSIEFIINHKNIGTVKSLNKALQKANGDYILFFAADDKLANSRVLSNFAQVFRNSSFNVITAQWTKCDEELNPLSNLLNPYEMTWYNKCNIKKQYNRLCCSNIYGSGATSYKSSIFQQYGYLDETYKYLEDWPFWLKLLSKNEKIYFVNFECLLHRSGGISSESSNITKSKQIFYKELLEVFYREIVPNLDRFSPLKKIKILKSYQFHINNYSFAIPIYKYNDQLKNTLNKDNKLKIIWYLNKIFPNLKEKIEILLKYNIIVPITVIIHLVVNFLLVNYLDLANNIILLFYVVSYFIIYEIVNSIYNIYKMMQK